MGTEKDFNNLLNETIKVNEYFDADLAGEFENIWVEELRDWISPNLYNELQPLITKAQEVIEAWTKQLEAGGHQKAFTGDAGWNKVPSGWLEGSDGFTDAAEGDIEGLKTYLQQVINFGTKLPI